MRPLKASRAFSAAPAWRTFERRDQRRERLLAADAARSFDGGPCDPVVGRSHGARNHTALRHGAAVTQPCEHRGPGFGVIARHAGGNPRKDLVVALAERLQSGIAVFGRSLLDGGQHVRHRLFGAERIGKHRESRTAHVLAVALEQALDGFHGRLGVSRGHEVRKQAQIGIGQRRCYPSRNRPAAAAASGLSEAREPQTASAL